MPSAVSQFPANRPPTIRKTINRVLTQLGSEHSDRITIQRYAPRRSSAIDQVVERVTAYSAAGADAICLVGVKDHRQLEHLRASVTIPVMLIAYAGSELGHIDYLSDNGICLYIDGHFSYYAAVRATYETLKALRDGIASNKLEGIASQELLGTACRGKDFDAWTKTFLYTQ
jgi:oxaloacetate decarboxylase